MISIKIIYNKEHKKLDKYWKLKKKNARTFSENGHGIKNSGSKQGLPNGQFESKRCFDILS